MPTDRTRRRPRTRTIVLALTAVAVIGIGALAFAFMRGYLGGDQEAHPPCEQLPSVATVRQSLADHPELAGQLRSQGTGIEVGVGTPCRGDTDAALVEVTYSDEREREAIHRVLEGANGFGVPVHLVRR